MARRVSCKNTKIRIDLQMNNLDFSSNQEKYVVKVVFCVKIHSFQLFFDVNDLTIIPDSTLNIKLICLHDISVN